MSASKLARLEAIGNNLTEVRFAKAWREGRLNESVAYELSKLPKARQKEAWDEYLYCGYGDPAGMSIKEAAAFCDGKDIFGHSAAPGIVSDSDTGDALSVSGGAAADSPGGSGESERVSNLDTWRRCLVDEPEEGQLVLLLDPDVLYMPDIALYHDGQYIDEGGDGEAMDVKSCHWWLPLPSFPLEVWQ